MINPKCKCGVWNDRSSCKRFTPICSYFNRARKVEDPESQAILCSLQKRLALNRKIIPFLFDKLRWLMPTILVYNPSCQGDSSIDFRLDRATVYESQTFLCNVHDKFCPMTSWCIRSILFSAIPLTSPKDKIRDNFFFPET